MIDCHDDRVLDAEQWKTEAQAIIDDVRQHVTNITISEKLQSTNSLIYLNLTTLEDLKFCIKVSAEGFKIIGNQHDTVMNSDHNEIYETPYSLLDSVSPQYRQSFGSTLMDKLQKLAQE